MINTSEILSFFLGRIIPTDAYVSGGNDGVNSRVINIWLVVWNMTFIFPYIGKNNPNWRTHIFQMAWNHQPVLFVIPFSLAVQQPPFFLNSQRILKTFLNGTQEPRRKERQSQRKCLGNRLAERNGISLDGGLSHFMLVSTCTPAIFWWFSLCHVNTRGSGVFPMRSKIPSFWVELVGIQHLNGVPFLWWWSSIVMEQFTRSGRWWLH